MINSTEAQYKYFTFLSMLYLTASLCSLVVAQKMCIIAGHIVMAGSFIYPLTFPISDILTEVYGYKRTRTVIWFSFFFQFVFALVCMATVNLQSPKSFISAGNYKVVLGHLMHIALGSLVAAIIGIFLNIYIISQSKIMLNGKFFAFRSMISSFIGETFYTCIALSMMSYGVLRFSELIRVICSSLILKIVCNLITIIPATFIVIFLKKNGEKNCNEENKFVITLTQLNSIGGATE